MRLTLRLFLLLLAWTALGRTEAWAVTANPLSATVGIRSGVQYPIQGFSGTPDLLNTINGYRFASLPPAASGNVWYPTNTNGTGTAYTQATVSTTPISLQQAANLVFIPVGGAAVGTITFTYTAQNPGIPTQVSAPATYTLSLSVADAQTSPVLSNTTGLKSIPTFSANSGAASPTNYRIITLPSTGTLYVNGTAATANQVISSTQAAQLSYTAAMGAFGTVSFTYAPADATGGTGDAATYAIPITTASCGVNNSVLDFSRRTIGEDWTNHASVAVNASNITSGNYSSVGASGGNSFIVDNNVALPGPSLAWRQVNTGNDPGTNGSGNTTTVTFTFDQPVRNLSLSIQDIDQTISATQAFTDALTLDGYSTAASTTPIALVAGNFALGNTNTFSGSNTVTGTGNSNVDPAGNIVVTFPSSVQRLTLTFKNIAPYSGATLLCRGMRSAACV